MKNNFYIIAGMLLFSIVMYMMIFIVPITLSENFGVIISYLISYINCIVLTVAIFKGIKEGVAK